MARLRHFFRRPRSDKKLHNTDIGSANVVHSGSGDLFIGSGFVPSPNMPVNGSNLPNRYPNFVGRQEDLQKVADALASRAWIVTIDGIGGIGKTTLALEVAHLCKDQDANYGTFPEFAGYIWTSARDKPDFGLDDVVRETLYVLSPFESNVRSLGSTEQVSLAIRALAAEPRLLVIDNFETVKDEPLHRFLRDQLPNPSKVLITSRHHLQTGEKVVPIGGLEEEDAVKLLRLEANRLNIVVGDEDTTRLLIIAKKSYGIPYVLRWAMESVYNGKSLEWVVESLENATSDDIFDYIFRLSLSTLDSETRTIFRSMAILPSWARIETITAMNPGTAAIADRVGRLVSLSLLDDNRRLVQTDRRYRLPPFGRYLAAKELKTIDDRGRSSIESVLRYYLHELRNLIRQNKQETDHYFDLEFINIQTVLKSAAAFREFVLLELCVQILEIARHLDNKKSYALVYQITEYIRESDHHSLKLRLLVNPFSYGRPVTPPFFYGRKKQMEFVKKVVEGDKRKSAFIHLVGPRRIGKTSFLQTLSKQRNEDSNCDYVYIDLQSPATWGKPEFLYHLARSITETLNLRLEEPDPRIGKPDREEFLQRPERAFNNFMESVSKQLVARRLVILLDEFEYLFHPQYQNETDALEIQALFRFMVQTGQLSFITAGVKPLNELLYSDVVSPLFNMAMVQRMSFLDTEEAIDLIRQPLAGIVDYDSGAVERLIQLSGGHPFVLQALCSEIIHICQERQQLFVSPEMSNVAASQVMVSVSPYFHFLYQDIGKVGQALLSAASSLVKGVNEDFTKEQLYQSVTSLTLTSAEFNDGIRSLVRNQLLVSSKGETLRFTMDIIRQWIIEEGTASANSLHE